jgi:hypothetical protein
MKGFSSNNNKTGEIMKIFILSIFATFAQVAILATTTILACQAALIIGVALTTLAAFIATADGFIKEINN